MRNATLLLAASTLLLSAGNVFAYGEGVDGFPSWEERTLLHLINGARVDPQLFLTSCIYNST